MSKKASGDQFSLSGGNSDSVGARKTVFCSGKDFFLGGSSYGYSLVFSLQQSYLGCNYGMCSEYFHFVWFDVHFQGVIFLELNKIKTALTEALGQLFLALGQL